VTLALVFSPQGSQSIGMGRELAAAEPAAAEVFARADELAGWSISELAWSGPAERLNDTRRTQPVLLTASIAAHAALAARCALRPAAVAGHSVGEYAALVVAGALEFSDALRLVTLRGELMSGAGDGGMTAVIGLDRARVESVVAEAAATDELVVANDNAPGQVVISGSHDALARTEARLREVGARRLVRLPVSGPFHSPRMAAVVGELSAAFETASWHDASVPVISNVTAEPVTEAATIRRLLAEQVRSPVEWVRSVQRMADDGIDTVIECGSGSALAGMVRRIAPEMRTAAVGDPAGLEAAAALLAEPAEASV
jgi:[acyl-carrier-protein] S-malonyltransferase